MQRKPLCNEMQRKSVGLSSVISLCPQQSVAADSESATAQLSPAASRKAQDAFPRLPPKRDERHDLPPSPVRAGPRGNATPLGPRDPSEGRGGTRVSHSLRGNTDETKFRRHSRLAPAKPSPRH